MGKIEKETTYKTKDGKEILIRNAEAGDFEGIINVNKSVINEKFYMLREPEEANYTSEFIRKDIENHLTGEGSMYIVAEVNGKVVGSLEFRNGEFRRTSHSGMFSMFILKEWRGKGIGNLLLQKLIDWAEKHPVIEKITLATFSTNERAYSLYQKFGFIEEGRCPKDMKLKDGTYMDSVLMYKFVK